MKNGDNVLDVGCGTGDLLFKAADQIKFGLGVDLDHKMVRFATQKKKKYNADHLNFIQDDMNSIKNVSDYKFNIATSTLCLHEMKQEEAVSTLKSLSANHSRVLIADYSDPKSFWAKFSIELDELISGHYARFREYRRNGYLPYLAELASLKIVKTKESPIDGILIWELRSENHT